MTNALQVLYGAEYFLRRQLSGEESTVPPPTGYHYNNGSNEYTDTIGSDNYDIESDIYFETSPPAMDGQAESSSNSQGRTILTILYLCVLGLCFVVPVFYYFRLHCFEEYARREMELDFTAALEQSEQHRDEARAARRKYIDERRARIVQLFGPVRMILREENFVSVVDPDNAHPFLPTSSDGGRLVVFPDAQSTGSSKYEYDTRKPNNNISRSDESATMASDGVFSPCNSDDDDDDGENDGGSHAYPQVHHPEPSNTSIISDDNMMEQRHENNSVEDQDENDTLTGNSHIETGVIRSNSVDEEEDGEHDEHNHKEQEINIGDADSSVNDNEAQRQKSKTSLQHNPYGDEDSIFIKIPVPGLPLDGSSLLDPTKPLHEGAGGISRDDRKMRLAPGLCTICLSNYQVGSDIVWSSNEACDHHFHASCIEKWLMKQREGPLCPCCRRDFIVDPFDLLEEEAIRNDDSAAETSEAGVPSVLQWDPAFLGLEDDIATGSRTIDLGPVVLNAPNESDGETTDIEEGLGFNSSISDARAVLSGGDSDFYEVSLAEDDNTHTRNRRDASA